MKSGRLPRRRNLAALAVMLLMLLVGWSGCADVEYARENFPKAQHVTLSTGNLLAPFVEVSAGRADVGIEDAWQAHRYALDHPEVADLFDGRPYNVLPIAWSVKRGNQDLL